MKHLKTTYKRIIIGVLGLFFIAGTSLLLTSHKSPDFEIVKHLDVFSSLIKELNLYYVDPVDAGESIKKGIDEMLKDLDPYTVYIPESKIEDLTFMTTGQYGGIGALIRKRGEYIMITNPYEGFPADKAGLRAGDIIIEIDGKDLKDLSTSQVSELLKGQPGTTLKLKVTRAVTEDSKQFSFEREKVQISPVPYYGMLDDKTGYVRLSSFTNKAFEEFNKAVKALKETENAESMVIDLRNNPGGLLIESVRICNLFIEQNETVVSTKGKVERWNKIYKAQMTPYDTEIPLVVLVNRGSASASEIVSGCIQDLDRGVVIGQRTFGKGLVQTTRDLSYNAKLKVTTAKYYIPSGRCIQALDYTHRNEDGSVGRVPDSLISEFQTKNGRSVYDGGGIRPDIAIPTEKLSRITAHLLIENLIFDFVSKYVHENQEAPELKDFKLTDEEYQTFIDFINEKSFDYETSSEESFKELMETAKKEKYYKVAEDEFAALEAKIAHDREKDLGLFRTEIKKIIEQKIIGRYYYQKGQLQYQLADDEEVKKALEILNNPEEYQGILDGSIDTDLELNE
ncbi:MAG: S41 family peptidase [Bacteroidales bacterium]|jgi:carboxyl-terminal processing protease|nr:S41 family peptidase [Bacteroidales bacterium]